MNTARRLLLLTGCAITGASIVTLIGCGGATVGGGAASFAAAMLVSSDQSGHYELYLMDASGTQFKQLTKGYFNTGGGSVSPDGQTIIFVAGERSGSELFKMNIDGTGVERLTDDPYKDGGARFTPDGSRVMFSSERGPNSDIYTMLPDGSDVVRITTDPALDHLPVPHPTEPVIAFVSDRVGGDQEIFAINTNTNAIDQLTDSGGQNMFPDYDPAGSKMVFTSTRTGLPEIYIMEATGGDSLQLTDLGDSFAPRFTPAGDEIVFARFTGDTITMWMMNTDGNNLRQVTDGTHSVGFMSWVPSP